MNARFPLDHIFPQPFKSSGRILSGIRVRVPASGSVVCTTGVRTGEDLVNHSHNHNFDHSFVIKRFQYQDSSRRSWETEHVGKARLSIPQRFVGKCKQSRPENPRKNPGRNQSRSCVLFGRLFCIYLDFRRALLPRDKNSGHFVLE